MVPSFIIYLLLWAGANFAALAFVSKWNRIGPLQMSFAVLFIPASILVLALIPNAIGA